MTKLLEHERSSFGFLSFLCHSSLHRQQHPNDRTFSNLALRYDVALLPGFTPPSYLRAHMGGEFAIPPAPAIKQTSLQLSPM